MRIRKGYILRSLLGQHLVFSDGSEGTIGDRQIVLNDTSAFLWKLLEKPRSRSELVDGLMEEYEGTREEMEEAVDGFIGEVSILGLLEEV